MFSNVSPRRVGYDVPSMVQDEDGLPFWVVDGGHTPIAIANGSAGRPSREWKNTAERFEDFRAGVTDPSARLSDMDLDGVWASLCFPSLVYSGA